MPAPSALSFYGIAKEATKGTGVVPTAYIPLKTFDPLDNLTYFEDTGMRGSMGDVYNEVAGPLWSTIDYGGDVFPDTLPWVMSGIMGDVATTGASAPFTHTMALKNSTDGQPTAFSLTDFYGFTGGTPARRYPGQQFSDLGLKWSADGMFSFTAKSVGFASSQVAKPTAAVSAIPPLPAWLATTSIGGSNRLFVEQGEMNFKRNATPVHTVDGTQAPYVIWVGALGVDGKMTMVMEDETELTRFLASTTTALVFNWQTGAGASLVQVQLTATKAQYKVGAIKRAKDYVQLEVSYKAVLNTTDVGASGGYSPAKAVFQNALPASTYA